MAKPVQRKKVDTRSESLCSGRPQIGLADAMKNHEGLVKGTREGIEQFEQGRFVRLSKATREQVQ